MQWLGFNWSGDICYSSDYFDQLYAYAVELINKGLAYVDELSADEIREYRGTLTQPGKNSPFRDRSVEENLALFKKCVPVASKKVKRVLCQNRYGVSVHRDARSGAVPH
ncbi:glutamate--tRNA ligase family protein [Enterobacter hormaechei]